MRKAAVETEPQKQMVRFAPVYVTTYEVSNVEPGGYKYDAVRLELIGDDRHWDRPCYVSAVVTSAVVWSVFYGTILCNDVSSVPDHRKSHTGPFQIKDKRNDKKNFLGQAEF